MSPVEIRSYDDLLEAARRRKAELNLTFEAIDRIAGVCEGYSAKLLSPRPMRHLGLVSLPLVMAALGIRFAIIEDVEQTQALQHRYEEGRGPGGERCEEGGRAQGKMDRQTRCL